MDSPSKEDIAVSFSGIEFGYTPGITVLRIEDLQIRRNEITVLSGRSGGGKSTLLQLINGMVRPDRGEISVNGLPIDYSNLSVLRLGMGYVVQHIGLFPHLTIRQNIDILGRVTGMGDTDLQQRVDELLDMVRLSPAYLTKYPHQLSGGEQQRAGLCRALLLRPGILLMDEPFASLDPGTKSAIYQHLLEIQQREPRTIVMVTHDSAEMHELADRFIILEDGRIKAIGQKDDLTNFKDLLTQ